MTTMKSGVYKIKKQFDNLPTQVKADLWYAIRSLIEGTTDLKAMYAESMLEYYYDEPEQTKETIDENNKR